MLQSYYVDVDIRDYGFFGRSADLCYDSDGIARVHGMSNVQAEELVE